jgi:hypothetical protein
MQQSSIPAITVAGLEGSPQSFFQLVFPCAILAQSTHSMLILVQVSMMLCHPASLLLLLPHSARK